MITNSSVTIYHKGYDDIKDIETWTRYNYSDTWFFGGIDASLNKGYDNANSFNCRIPYDKNSGLDISHFSIGDIVVQGTLETNINTQQDLENYLVYNITSCNNNNFGNNPHIHIGGK